MPAGKALVIKAATFYLDPEPAGGVRWTPSSIWRSRRAANSACGDFLVDGIHSTDHASQNQSFGDGFVLKAGETLMSEISVGSASVSLYGQLVPA